MASSRQQPTDMTFQIRAIPGSLDDDLHEWGPNKQLARMIDGIGVRDHLQDLQERIQNLSVTSVHQRDLTHSTTTAILASLLPVVILAGLAAAAVAAWKLWGPRAVTCAQAWARKRRANRQPYNLYVKRRRWNNPPPTPELMEEQGSELSIDIPPPSPLLGSAADVVEEDSDFTGSPPPPTPPPPPPPGRPGSPMLPSHPAIRMSQEEQQVHRDAILQQQMLGRQLLRELRERHQKRHHI